MQYRPHHTAISVRNIENSLKFYSDLGFKEIHRWVADDDSLTIVQMKLSEYQLEIFAYANNGSIEKVEFEYANNLNDLGVKHMALRVDNLNDALKDLRKKGYANDSTEIKHGRTMVDYFFVQDPDGVWVEVVEDNRGY